METQPRSGMADEVFGKHRGGAAAGGGVSSSLSEISLPGRMPQAAGWEVEEQVEHMRRAALREAARQARRAAAERLEAARRAEAAAMADSIARREEREIAETQAIILRQAAKYAEAEMRGRRKRYLQARIPPAFPPAVRGTAPNHGSLFDGDAGQLRQRSALGLELGQRQAAQYPAASDAEVGRSAAEIIGGITEAPLDEPCWCEAERLIGTGYSKLEGALSRGPDREQRTDGLRLARWQAEGAAMDSAHSPGLSPHPRRPGMQRGPERGPDWTDYPVQIQAKRRLGASHVRRHPAFVAVYSSAGGAGKTSLVANLGRALASRGARVLLAEITGQRRLPLYFDGSRCQAGGMLHAAPADGCTDTPIDVVSYDLADFASKASCPGGTCIRRSEGEVHGEVFRDMVWRARRADWVLIDLDGNSGWMVARMAWMNPTILVPLEADMESVASLETVERRFNVMQDAEGRPLEPVYLLNQFDDSSALSRDVRDALKQRLGRRLLPLAVRRSSGVSEALAKGMTVVDRDPDSHVAKDYFAVAEWLRNDSDPASYRVPWTE